jgi:hypothetical protein
MTLNRFWRDLMNSPTEAHLHNGQIQIVDSWQKFRKLVAGPKYRSWAFRGQANCDWPLYSTLSRYLSDYKIQKKAWPFQEQRILRIFCRKASLFLQHVPKKADVLQWLALMQHHGAPTRLLDFTWSPFVAAFFALERATGDCAVWGIKFPKLWEVKHTFPEKQSAIDAPEPRTQKDYKRFFLWNEVPFLATGEPFDMNQRLIAQSGTFVIPGVLDRPVEAIVTAAYPNPKDTLVKFVLKTGKLRDHAMLELYNMNITNATLFPGLDGMARSLAYELEFHWGFNPKTLKNYPGYRFVES